MKRYSVLLLIFIAMAMQSITYANQSNNKNEVIDNTYVKGQKEMSLNFSEVPPEIEMKLKDVILAGNDGGNEYFVIIPPNDAGASTGELGIYICSGNNTNTRVIVERCDEGIVVNTTIPNKYQLLWLTQNGTPVDGGVSVTLLGIAESEILNRNQYPATHNEDVISPNQGYRIYTEPDPITGIAPDIYVYSASFRQVTAEGYMALPTSGLGKKYVHCSSPDNDETGNNLEENPTSGKWRTGFTAIATQDNTTINYQLISTTYQHVCISFNKKPANGLTYSSPLMQTCDVWTLCNGINPVQNQVCDFSGTIVESAKNFAFISWSQRTSIPTGRDYSRDNLCEQLLPVDKWGNKYITVQMKGEYEASSKWRNHPGGKDKWSNQNPGNYFRMVAKEPGTNITVKWYSLENYVLVGYEQFYLDSLGQMAEYLAIPGEFTATSMPQHSVAGVAVWESNKPFQLMQYQITQSLYWYTSNIMDPAMVIVPPFAQYGNATTFVSGCNETKAQFKEHYVTLIAEGPKNSDGTPNLDIDDVEETLNNIIMYTNGKNPQSISYFDADFYAQKVPNENYYFARYQLNPNCVYRIEGKTKMSAIVYGWGDAISYIWPASMRLVSTDGLDTIPPKVWQEIRSDVPTRPGNTGYIACEVHWADTIKDYGGDQEDKGLVKAPFITYNETNNLAHNRYFYDRPPAPPSNIWRTGGNWLAGSVTYRTLDPYQDVFAIILIEDAAGNESLCTLNYIADKLEFFNTNGTVKTEINFGDVADIVYDTTIIKNMNTTPSITYIEEIFLIGAPENEFKIEKIILMKNNTEVDLNDPITFEPEEEIMVVLSFNPQNTGNFSEQLMIYTQCLYWNLYMYGSCSGYPRITVTDYDFGNVFVEVRSVTGGSVKIINNGNMPLTITGYYFEKTIESDTDCVFEEGPFWYAPVYGNDNFPITIQPGIPYTIQNLWVIPFIQGGDSVRLYFVNDADATFDVEYKDYALLEVNGFETGAAITFYDWQQRRVNTMNEGTIYLTNYGESTDITIKEIVGEGWTLVRDTLYSFGRHYFVPDISQYEGKVIKPHDGTEYPPENDERTIEIAVRFNPQSEYPHIENGFSIGNCPLLDNFYVNFTTESNIPNYTIYSKLRGEAWLPKIEATGWTWNTNTEKETLSEEIGEITIKNISYTSELRIKEINLLQTEQWEDFQIIGSYNDITIARSNDNAINELIIPVEFLPLSSNSPTRRCYVEIISDAKNGDGNPGEPDPNPTIKDTVLLMAFCYESDYKSIGLIDYGTITRCDNPENSLLIFNFSTTSDIEVYEIEIESEYANLFEQTTHLDFPITINPNNNAQVNFRFEPCKWEDLNTGEKLQEKLTSKVIVKTNIGIDTTTFNASPRIIPIRLTGPYIPTTSAGTLINIPIDIQLANDNISFYNFANANITSFTMKIAVDKDALSFEGDYLNAQDGWTFNVVQDSEGLVTITGSGPCLQAGICAIPQAKTGSKNILMQIVEFNVNDRECCIDWISDPCSIKYEEPILAETGCSLSPVSPNPYTANTLIFNYSIRKNGNATLGIYNSAGELVKSVLNGYTTVDDYTANVDISNLVSGAYTIVLKSEQFEEIQKLIILK